MDLLSFQVWSHVLEHCRKHGQVWYRAPLDARPVLVRATCRPKGRTVRVSPMGYWPRGKRPFDPFAADAGHLDRFWR